MSVMIFFRNKARLAKHYEKHQVYNCEICNEWDERKLGREADITKHFFFNSWDSRQYIDW